MTARARRPTDAQAAAFTRCRSLGHSWDPIPVTRPPAFGVAIDLRCEHCATYRRDIISPHSGQLLQRAYQHPDGYKDPDRLTRSDWRANWVSTLGEALARPADDVALRVIRGSGERSA